MRSIPRAVAPLAVALVAAAGYLGALGGDFVFDDLRQVRDNPLIRDLGNYLGSWAGYRAMPNRYVGYLSFALSYGLSGPAPAAFRAANVALHVANALLVYALVALAFRTPRLASSALAPSARAPAFAAAAVFGAHPVETEAVTYVVQRLTSLAAFFSLACLCLYLRWRLAGRERGRSRLARAASYIPILAAALLAMKTKESAFTLPFAAVLVEVALLDGPLRPRLVALAPLLGTLAVIPLTLLAAPDLPSLGDTEVTGQGALGPAAYLATQLTVLPAYLRLLAFPVGQSADHDHPVHRTLLDPAVALSFAFLLALFGIGVWLVRRGRGGGGRDPALALVGLGILWFFATIAVESSVVPLADVMVERRAYLPSVGILVAAVTAAALFWQRASPARWAAGLSASATLLSLALAAATAARNAVWRDEVSLWADAARKAPRKPRPHLNLGVAWHERGRVDDAIRELRIAAELAPGLADAHVNLGVALGSKGMWEEARREMRIGARLRGAPAAP
jgi:tetratricopeptide (TPR) repeat protein